MGDYIWATTRWDRQDTLADQIKDYIKKDLSITRSISNVVSDKPKKPTINQVIFNNPATIILWTDNTKTIVKCQEGDDYDMEKGFVMAYLKKLLGNDNTFNKEINKWVYGGK